MLDDRLQILGDKFRVLDDNGRGVSYTDVSENDNILLFACLNHY